MRCRRLNLLQFCPRQRQQLVLHAQKMLADNRQIRFRQQKVHVRHPSRIGIFHRYHRKVRLTVVHQFHRLFKRIGGNIVCPWKKFLAGNVRISARRALKRDFCIFIFLPIKPTVKAYKKMPNCQAGYAARLHFSHSSKKRQKKLDKNMKIQYSIL